MGLNRLLVIISMILSSVTMQGQSFYKIIGTTGSDYAEKVINDRDSGYVIVGGTEGLGQGEMDGYMIKLDTSGNLQWTRTFGGEGVDWLTDVLLLDDGFLACGYTNVLGNYQAYVTRTNEVGQVIWERELGNENWEFPNEMTLVNDTTILMVGKVYQDGETTTDALLCTFNLNGDSLSYLVIGDSYNDELERVVKSSAGELFVCGSYGVEEGNNDYWLGRVDSLGNFEWELFLGDTLNDFAHGLAEIAPGEFIVSGGDDSGGSTGIDNVFYKFDNSGNVIFPNYLNGPGDDVGIEVMSYSDTNKFILVSRSSSVGNGEFDTWVFDCHNSTYGAFDLEYDFGTSNNELVMDADTTFDQGAICVGNMYDDQLGNVIFVHKANSELTAIFTYSTEQDLVVDDYIVTENVTYPNPAHRHLIFSDPSVIGEKYQIFNLQGSLLDQGVISSSSISLNLTSGYYLIQLEDTVYRFSVVAP